LGELGFKPNGDLLEGSADCYLFMRPQGDSRPDTVVKRELFEKYVEPNWHISFVIDDRKSVVQMWRDLGLYVFNCGLDIDF
jgi:hypothetical protein